MAVRRSDPAHPGAFDLRFPEHARGIRIHRLGERALHADREAVLVARIALQHAQAAPAGAERLSIRDPE